MNPDAVIGWALAGIGAGLLLFNAWLTHVDNRNRRARTEAALRAHQATEFPDPAFIERLRADVQAAAWEHERTPIADRLAEERFAQQLQGDGRPSWLP